MLATLFNTFVTVLGRLKITSMNRMNRVCHTGVTNTKVPLPSFLSEKFREFVTYELFTAKSLFIRVAHYVIHVKI